MNLKETIIDKEEIFKGNVIEVEKYNVRLPNDKTASREIVHHKGAVCLIAIENDEMYFVKQHRIAPDEILLEIPAGKLEVSELPLMTAEKELKEEIGGTCDSLELVHTFYVSPGFSDEVVYLYEAHGLKVGEQDLEDDEFLEIVKYPLSSLQQLLNNHTFKDAKTIMAVQYVLLKHSQQS